MEALAKKFQGKVQFVFVYSQEIHANQAMKALPGSGLKTLPNLAPSASPAERDERARDFRRLMNGSVRRFLIDEDDSSEDGICKVQRQYHAELSSRIFVINRDRRIAADVSMVVDLESRLSQLLPESASELPAE